MIEKHVVSLEIAKQLKEAGWTKETEFWWVIYDKDWFLAHIDEGLTDTNNQIPAPLATEILEELPKGKIRILNRYKHYEVYFEHDDKLPIDQQYITNMSLPEALANMWLYLKKEKLL